MACSNPFKSLFHLTSHLLADTLWRQAPLLAVIALVVVVVAARELLPLMEATNEVMARLQHLLEHQKRFVRDTAHQLRTPLTVLKVQVQSALHGDMDAHEALADITRRWIAPRCWPTRCWRWPRWSSCASSPTSRPSIWPG